MKSVRSKHILLQGLSQANMIGPLYSGIVKHSDLKLSVRSFHFRVFSEKDNHKELFKEISPATFKIKSKQSFYKHLFLFLTHSSLWFIYFKLKRSKVEKKFIAYLKEMFEVYKDAQSLKAIPEIDFYHVHFLRYTTVLPFLFIKDKPVLMSFWGSDLLRNNDPIEDIYRGYALKNASTITIQNEQLAQIAKERFPVVASKKIKVVRFLPDDDFVATLKQYALQKKTTSIAEYHIMVGHNGSKENQHIKILDAIAQVKTDKKIIIHLLLSYALLDEYHQELLEAIKGYDFAIRLQYEYLSQQALLDYRAQMDLLIFAPISDAMSGTVTEALYLGTKVIAGNWLPYNVYHSIDCSLYFFDAFDQLSTCVETCIAEENTYDINVTHKQLEAAFGTLPNAKKWIAIIHQL